MLRHCIWLLLSFGCLQVSADYQARLEKRGACPMHYVTGPNDVCYRFSEDYKSFTQAQKQCETEGARLVNTQSQAVYRFVKQTIEANPKKPKIAWIFGKISKIFTKWHSGYWIGARRHNGNGGAFRWLNGKPVFGHWLSGMPDNGRLFLINWIHEDCLQQLESWHGWNDAQCSTKLRYVCEKAAADPCTEC